MLPLVLGGIALAAVGYGVKEYCELEGCPWDGKPYRDCDEKDDRPLNIFDTIDHRKKLLATQFLSSLKQCLSLVKHHKKWELHDIEPLGQVHLSASDLPSDVLFYAQAYSDFIDHLRYSVEDIMGSLHFCSENEEVLYDKLNPQQQEHIKYAFKIYALCSDALTLDFVKEGELNLESVAKLKKLEKKLKNIEESGTFETIKRMFGGDK